MFWRCKLSPVGLRIRDLSIHTYMIMQSVNCFVALCQPSPCTAGWPLQANCHQMVINGQSHPVEPQTSLSLAEVGLRLKGTFILPHSMCKFHMR